jgi:Zn-dependent M28 family amino/carboxypeptidase
VPWVVFWWGNMRLLNVLLLSACALSATATAQTFSPERIRADVAFLADDLLEGRGTGTRGYDLAARYVASRLEGMGLKPGGADGSWYQDIPFVSASLDPAVPSAVTIAGQRFSQGNHVIVSSTVAAPKIDETAEAVFVGYGLEDQSVGLDDYRGLDVRGKIVVYLWGVPDGLPSEIAATLSDKKNELAVSKGAVGVISVATPKLMKILPWERFVANNALPKMRWVHPDGRIEDPVGPLRLSALIDQTAAERLFQGTPLDGGKLAALFGNPKARPKGFALKSPIRVERSSVIERTRSANVLGLLPGSDPTLAGEVVMLSGHLDHLGLKPGAAAGDHVYNGAMDNAVGIATMLEAAKAFTESGARPKRSVMFVALTAEEKGLFGSEYLASYPAYGGRKLVANVNLDMPILTYDFSDVVAFGAEHSTIGQAVASAAGKIGVSLSPDPAPEQQSFVRTDHYSFVKKGVPAVSLNTGFAQGGKKATETFESRHYHALSDEIDQPFNWNAAAKFARINYLIARELADAPEAPRWYEGNYFGNRFAPGQAKARKP